MTAELIHTPAGTALIYASPKEGRSMQGRVSMPDGTGAPAAGPAPLPEPSLELAQRTLDYAHRAGLVTVLMQMAGARNDEELITWVQRQGDLWFALCRMAELAESKQ